MRWMNKSEMQARSLIRNFEACQQSQSRKLSEESVAVAEYSYFLSSFLGSLLCRKCGHDITTAVHLYNKASKLALRQRNDTILGVQQRLIQLFKNPHGTLIYAIVFLYHCQTISSATSRPWDRGGGGWGGGVQKKFLFLMSLDVVYFMDIIFILWVFYLSLLR